MGSFRTQLALTLLCFVAEYCYGQELNKSGNSRLRSLKDVVGPSKPNLRAALQRLVHNKPLPHPDVLGMRKASLESSESGPLASDTSLQSLRSNLQQNDAEDSLESSQSEELTLQDILKDSSAADVTVEELDDTDLHESTTVSEELEVVQSVEMEHDDEQDPNVTVEEVEKPEDSPITTRVTDTEASARSSFMPRRRPVAPRPCHYDYVPMHIKGSSWAFPGQEHNIPAQHEANPFDYELPYRHMPNSIKDDLELDNESGFQGLQHYPNQASTLPGSPHYPRRTLGPYRNPYPHSLNNRLNPYGHPYISGLGQPSYGTPSAAYDNYNLYGARQHYPYSENAPYSKQFGAHRQTSAHNQYRPYDQQSGYSQYQPYGQYHQPNYGQYDDLRHYAPYVPLRGPWNKNIPPFGLSKYDVSRPYTYNTARRSLAMPSSPKPKRYNSL